jgi:hypothetical protein
MEAQPERLCGLIFFCTLCVDKIVRKNRIGHASA